MATPPRRLQELPEAEALRLLGSTPFGRIVFTAGGLPSIRPVMHLVDDGRLIVRTHFASSALESSGPLVVAYEADVIDADERTAWSVIVTGMAHLIRDADEIAVFDERLPEAWVDDVTPQLIRIEPEVVTGYAVVKAEDQGVAT